MIFVGFDPDLHYPSYGVVEVFSDGTFAVIGYGCLDVPKGYTGYNAVKQCARQMDELCLRIREHQPLSHTTVDIYIEAMVVRPKQREAINGLLKLQAVSGAFTSSIIGMLWDVEQLGIEFVEPHEWKGQVPKDVHQRRILSKLGINRGDLKLPEKYAKHVVDAIGIAHWAALKKTKKRLTPASPVLR